MISFSVVTKSYSATGNDFENQFEIQFIRHATIKISLSGATFLIDPMFSAAGGLPTFSGTYNQDLRNPLVDLPLETKDILGNVDAVVVTHLHMDPWDKVAQKEIPKKNTNICAKRY